MSGISCYDALYPLMVAFPPGALALVAGKLQIKWPDGWITVMFERRTELYDCMVVTGLARELGLSVTEIERLDGAVRVVMK